MSVSHIKKIGSYSSYDTDLMQHCARNQCTLVCEGKYSRVRGEALACARESHNCVSRNTRVLRAFRVYDNS